jgi:hypothetical protein
MMSGATTVVVVAAFAVFWSLLKFISWFLFLPVPLRFTRPAGPGRGSRLHAAAR